MLSAPLKPLQPSAFTRRFLLPYLAVGALCLMLQIPGARTGSLPIAGPAYDLLLLFFTAAFFYTLSRHSHRQILSETLRKRVITRNSSEAIVTVDDAGRVLEFNPQAEELFGFSREEVVGRPVDLHPTLRRSLLVDAPPAGSPGRLTSVVTRDGRDVSVEMTLAILAEDQNVTLTGFFHEIPPTPEGPRAVPGNLSLQGETDSADIELSLAYETVLEGWVRALDMRDRETQGHTRRVTEMTLRLAIALGVSDEELRHIRRGALLHDIGKIGISDTILLKPGPLTPEERKIIQLHPEHAHHFLAPLEFLQPAMDIPCCHHEKWDGTGYPRGIKGSDIPFSARIFAVVDVWDALRSDRPYRDGWSDDKVCEYLRSQAGEHFDPDIVPVFLNLLKSPPHFDFGF